MEIDGLISVDGSDAQTVGMGGGAGGSILLITDNFKGKLIVPEIFRFSFFIFIAFNSNLVTTRE